jgi:hypothetical protein
MEAVRTSCTSVSFCRTARRDTDLPEGSHLHVAVELRGGTQTCQKAAISLHCRLIQVLIKNGKFNYFDTVYLRKTGRKTKAFATCFTDREPCAMLSVSNINLYIHDSLVIPVLNDVHNFVALSDSHTSTYVVLRYV